MTQEKAHAGIELDTIDLSCLTGLNTPGKTGTTVSEITDYKDFIRDIYKKIHDNDSFLSFSVQINDVNRILKMKYSSANDIANVILKDVALTTKLLKLVNSSFYGQFSQKGIPTISEAMIILGTEEIQLAAASLKLYEFMQEIATVKILKNKALKALQRSLVARQIAKDEGLNDAEAIQISAMLYDFGEYLVALFAPQVYVDIEICSEENNLKKDLAAKKIIGVSYSALGRFVASKWHLPESILHSMQPVDTYDIAKNKLTTVQKLQYICAFSNLLCDIQISMEGKYIGSRIVEICDQFKTSLNIPTTRGVELLKMSWQNINKHAAILGVRMETEN